MLCCLLVAACAEPTEMGEIPIRITDPAKTMLSPTLEAPLQPEINVIWCATYQKTWDQLMQLSGGPLKTREQSAAVDALNRGMLPAKALPSEGTICEAGLVEDGIVERIQEKLKQLPGSPTSTLLSEQWPPDALISYAYLTRDLSFQESFEVDQWIDYSNSGMTVATWGFEDYVERTKQDKARGQQVRVLWHEFDMEDFEQQFILEIMTENKGDRLILAKVSSEKTLQTTVKELLKRIEKPNTKVFSADRLAPEIEALHEELPDDPDEAMARRTQIYQGISAYASLLLDETLRVPVIRFDLTQQFDELVGLTMVSENPAINDKPIFEARQRVRFNLYEKGATLESEAITVLFGSLAMRNFEFDLPFLVLLMRRDAPSPYFVAWVANTDLLEAQPHTPDDFNEMIETDLQQND